MNYYNQVPEWEWYWANSVWLKGTFIKSNDILDDVISVRHGVQQSVALWFKDTLISLGSVTLLRSDET